MASDGLIPLIHLQYSVVSCLRRQFAKVCPKNSNPPNRGSLACVRCSSRVLPKKHHMHAHLIPECLGCGFFSLRRRYFAHRRGFLHPRAAGRCGRTAHQGTVEPTAAAEYGRGEAACYQLANKRFWRCCLFSTYFSQHKQVFAAKPQEKVLKTAIFPLGFSESFKNSFKIVHFSYRCFGFSHDIAQLHTMMHMHIEKSRYRIFVHT